MNQYRCETCKFLIKDPVDWGFDPYCHISVPIKLDNWEWVKRWGCASHSDFQNQREKVLNELIAHYKKVIEDGKGVTYNHPITYQWMYGGVVKHLEELRQAGEP